MLEIPKENSNLTSSHGSYGLWSAYLAGGDVVIADGYSGHQECNSIHFKNIIKIITQVPFKKQICFIKILFLLFFVATFWVFFVMIVVIIYILMSFECIESRPRSWAPRLRGLSSPSRLPGSWTGPSYGTGATRGTRVASSPKSARRTRQNMASKTSRCEVQMLS